MSKIRKQIYIDRAHQTKLKRLARHLKLSEAEIIRQAIDTQTAGLQTAATDPAGWERERRFIRALLKRPERAQIRTWKRTDLYDR